MNTLLTHWTDVIRETTAEGPYLHEGEQIEYEAVMGISATEKILSVILLFVPPLFLIWSILLLGISFLTNKRHKIWVTKERVIYSRWKFRNYHVISIPMTKIQEVKQAGSADIIDILFGIVDRIFGTSDVVIILKGSDGSIISKVLNSIVLTDVKAPKKFMEIVKKMSANALDARVLEIPTIDG